MLNYSFYSIPVAWGLAIAPHVYALALHDGHYKKQPFDNLAPRTMISAISSDKSLPPQLKGRIIRAEGAQQNGFENLGLYAAAIVAGNMAGLSASKMNILSGSYLASRALYNIVYINNQTKGVAGFRSLLWMVGIGICMSIFGMAGASMGSS